LARLVQKADVMPPRQIIPGRTWFVTRRTTRRHFLLRPDRDGTSQQIYWYTTAVLAKKFGIQLHAVQVMSTHIHEVLTDPLGNLPRFVQERNRALANALKCHRDWPEEVFQRASANYIELHGAKAILEKIAYTLANCVEAGLVRTPEAWPGVTVTSVQIGAHTVSSKRPAMYFDPNNPVWPTTASIDIQMPAPLTQTYGSGAAGALARAVREAVTRAQSSVQQARGFARSIGRLMRISPYERASSHEAHRKKTPFFSTGGDAERARLLRAERRAFLDAYRRALEAWGSRIPHPPFPPGTWRWRKELLRRAATSILVISDKERGDMPV